MDETDMPYPRGIKLCCTWLVLLYLGCAFSAHAQFFHHAQVRDVSQSGKSIVINYGMIEGLHKGARARFYRDEARLDFIGVGRAVKVNDSYSFWYLSESSSELKPKAEQKVFFALEEEILEGRRPVKVLQTQSVRARDRQEQARTKNSPPKDLIEREHEFIAGEETTNTRPSVDYDIKTLEEMPWEGGEISHLVEDYPGEIKSVRPSEEFELKDTQKLRQEKKQLSAASITDGAVKKAELLANKPRRQGTLTQDEDFSNTINNTFEDYEQSVTARADLAKETKERVKRDGELWSAGLSDSELRRTIIESGVVQERERRRRVASNLASHHLNFRYSTAMAAQTNDVDPNHNGNNYSMSLAYEYMLEHASESLARWSLEGILERGISYQDLGMNTNGRIAWGALGLQVNWFPLARPTAIRTLIPFVGLGLKRGNGDLESAQLSTSYEIQLLGTQLHAGLRFRFAGGDENMTDESIPMGMGIFVMVSQESNRMNVESIVQESIDTVYTTSEQRWSFGLSVFF